MATRPPLDSPVRFAHERRQEIVARARRSGRVGVAELADDLGVTQETIRRDLSQLEQTGLIRRVHGGAISAENQRLEPEVVERSLSMMEAKRAIAERALGELPGEGTVFLDAGTTTGELADVLPAGRQLTVVTHSLSIALTLAGRPSYRVLTVGGEVRGTTLATVGPWATDRLGLINTDVAFIATNGITPDRGLTTPNHLEAAIKRRIIQTAKRVVLLADHTKVGPEYFETFAAASDVDLFITSAGIDATLADRLAATGMRIVTT